MTAREEDLRCRENRDKTRGGPRRKIIERVELASRTREERENEEEKR